MQLPMARRKQRNPALPSPATSCGRAEALIKITSRRLRINCRQPHGQQTAAHEGRRSSGPRPPSQQLEGATRESHGTGTHPHRKPGSVCRLWFACHAPVLSPPFPSAHWRRGERWGGPAALGCGWAFPRPQKEAAGRPIDWGEGLLHSQMLPSAAVILLK